MIRLNENGTVRLAGLQPEMDPALYAADKVFAKYSLDTVITAGTEEFYPDGTLIHAKDSLHPRGFAVDLRNRHIPNGVYTKLISDLRDALAAISPAYQLILKHSNHFHIEYDLKVAYALNLGRFRRLVA